MSRYATAEETARVLALLDTGGSWTRAELGCSARVCHSHVDSAIRSIGYRKGMSIVSTRTEPRLYELVRRDER